MLSEEIFRRQLADHYATIQAANDLLLSVDCKRSIPQLAAHLGLSARTLHLAFQRRYRVGLGRFRNLHRMHTVRQALLGRRRRPGSVMCAGLEAGSEDPTALSKVCWRCFGQSPRDMLRRKLG